MTTSLTKTKTAARYFSLVALAFLLGSAVQVPAAIAGSDSCEDAFADSLAAPVERTETRNGFTYRVVDEALPASYYARVAEFLQAWRSEADDGRELDRLFSARGFNPSYRFPDGKTFLTYAAEVDQSGTITARLLADGLDPYQRDESGKNQLTEILENQQLRQRFAVLSAIIRGQPQFKSYAQYRLRLPEPADFIVPSIDGHPARNALMTIEPQMMNMILHTLLRTKNVNLMRHLIEDLGVRDFVETPAGAQRVFDHLGRLVVSFENKDAGFVYPAIESNSVELLQLFIRNNLDVNQHIRRRVVKRAHEEELSSMFRRKPDPDPYDTPLTYAIWGRRDLRIVALLLDGGANAAATDSDGRTAMNWALAIRARYGNRIYVDYLKSRGVPMPSIWQQIWPPGPRAD